MTPLDHIRTIALLLPEVEERGDGFHVRGACFARVEGNTVSLRQDDGWDVVSLADDADMTLVEDRVARSWELTAPDELLEAGGR